MEYVILNSDFDQSYIDNIVLIFYTFKYTSNNSEIVKTYGLAWGDKDQGGENPIIWDGSEIVDCRNWDWDHIGKGLAKYLIRDNDGEIEVSYYDDIYEDPGNFTLTKEFEFKEITEEECTHGLWLSADRNGDVWQNRYYDMDGCDISVVAEAFDCEDIEMLYELDFEDGEIDCVELMQIEGDETISVELKDDSGDTIHDEIEIHESNIYHYESDGESELNIDNMPDTLLIVSHQMKRSSCFFKVPEGFDPKCIRFVMEERTKEYARLGCWSGLSTSLTSFYYKGRKFICDDICDCGDTGYCKFCMYQKNKETNKYEFIGEIEGIL